MGTSGGDCAFGVKWTSTGSASDQTLPASSTITISSQGADGSTGKLKYNVGQRYNTTACADGFKVLEISGSMLDVPGATRACPGYKVGSGSGASGPNRSMTTSAGTCVTHPVGSGGSSEYDMCTGNFVI